MTRKAVFYTRSLRTRHLSHVTNQISMAVLTILLVVMATMIDPNIAYKHPSYAHSTYNPQPMIDRYEKWMAKYGRSYGDKNEWSLRFGIYQSNVQFIDFINSQGYSFKLVDNKFADMTNMEFKAMYLGLKPTSNDTAQGKLREDTKDSEVPETIDWRKRGAVTGIKDQGQCGSCWAFSAVAAVEGINHIKTGKLVSLSEQELVDCDRKGLNEGCNGGFMEEAFEYIKENGGLTVEANYPYSGKDGKCNKTRATNKTAKITGYKKVPTNSEESLKVAAAKQPVAVAVDGGSYAFQFYSFGIFSGLCNTQLNHGVAIVGYGKEMGMDYWIVKNSWGKDWGEDGYMRMWRNVPEKEGLCGIAMEPSYPTKESS